MSPASREAPKRTATSARRIAVHVIRMPDGSYAVCVGHHVRRSRGDPTRDVRALLIQQFASGDAIIFARSVFRSITDVLHAVDAALEHGSEKIMPTQPIVCASRGDVERAIRDRSAQVINVVEAQPGQRLRVIIGSVNIPLSQLERRLGEIDRMRDVITYCAGQTCNASAKAASLLASKGYRVRRYDGGMEDWVQARGETALAH